MEQTLWNTKAVNREARLNRASQVLGKRMNGKSLPHNAIIELLETVIEPGDRVCLEGNNQKQADFLAQSLNNVDPKRIHGLHMVQSVLALPEHLDIFEIGRAHV